MKKLSCSKAKEIDLVDYLASLGHFPQRIKNDDHWYYSPFRSERTPSFKVNKALNLWYDFGEGQGGDLIDFGVKFFRCSINELLEKLGAVSRLGFSFHPQSSAGEKKAPSDSKTLITSIHPLASKSLLEYFQKRCIPVEIAGQFCKEVDFILYGKKHTAIGFQNSAGGYELRNENFKGSSSPKDVTFVDNNLSKLSVFEGFFSYLSFQTIRQNNYHPLTNFLVLNSLSFFQKSREKMERHEQIHLYLDRDSAGKNCTQQALMWDKTKYVDCSKRYEKRKDLNDWLINQEDRQKQSFRHGRHL